MLARMALATSLAPSTEAVMASSPYSLRLRKMFSRTTTELSTIIPTPRASPPRVMRLRVRPPSSRSAKVATMEIGIEAAMTSVLRKLRRKKSSTKIAKPLP